MAKPSLHHLVWGKIHVWGIRLKYRPTLLGRSQIILVLDLNNHTWELTLFGRRNAPWLAKPSEPRWWQGVLCVTGILSLQALMTWLDNAPLNDLYIALEMLLILLGAWVVCRIIRRRRDER